MTNEEAIKELKEELKEIITWLAITINKEEMYERKERRKRAIEAALIALEQQPCEDCVARSEALDILDDFEVDIENGKFKTAYAKARERMCELPPVTPQPKIGKWIDTGIGKEELYGEMFVCSECNEVSYGENYCPNCGAKMEVEE